MNAESYWLTRKEMVEKALQRFLSHLYEGRSLEIARYMVAGGKRLRGVLALLVCEALGGRPENALDIAVAAELVHAASIAHDDVIDHEEKRRGELAAWVRFGLARAVLTPHMLVSNALLMIRRYGFKALEMAIGTWLEVTKGEIADVLGGDTFAERAYDFIARAKTGAPFALSSALGAIAARRDDLTDVAERYGAVMGFAFQVADDIVELAKINSGGPADMIRNPSLVPFLLYISEGKLRSPSKVTKESVEKALVKLKTLMALAKEATNSFPDGELKPVLLEFPDFAIQKMLSEVGL